MNLREFYLKFANTPLNRRYTIVNLKKTGLLTLNLLYDRVRDLEYEMGPMRIEQEKLLKLAEEYFKSLEKK